MITCEDFKSLKEKDIHPLVYTLLEMDERIRLNPLYGDIDENKGFFVTKTAIHIPYALPKLQHDLAHLLELRNPRRWTLPDWGMPRFDAEKIEATCFFAALSREIRTRAIQCHLTIFESEQQKCASTAYSQLNNEYWRSMVQKLLPFGRFKTFQDVETWMCDLRERTFNAWSLDRIHYEWTVRLNHIQHWMETNHDATHQAKAA